MKEKNRKTIKQNKLFLGSGSLILFVVLGIWLFLNACLFQEHSFSLLRKPIIVNGIINGVAEFKGKLYFIINNGKYSNELWEFDGDSSLKKLIDYSNFEAMEAQGKSELKFDIGYEHANHVRGISSLAVANNKLYFSFSNGRASNRLFQYNFTKGPLVIDGVTSVNHLTTWDNFGLVYSAISDNGTNGFFTIDEKDNIKFLTESTTSFPNFIQDDILYSSYYALPVIDSDLCITYNGCPFILKQNGVYKSWKFPKRFRVKHWAQIENGIFIVDNLFGSFLRIEDDCQTIKDVSTLPEYMHVYKISDDIKSIDNTVYFNAKSAPPSKSKVLYYKNKKIFGDVTEEFKNNGIEVKDLITSFQKNLIIGKSIETEKNYTTILQSYNLETKELKDITFLGKPMEIDNNSVAFQYKEYLYFVGDNIENKNCLWRYDGINDPELVKVKNISK